MSGEFGDDIQKSGKGASDAGNNASAHESFMQELHKSADNSNAASQTEHVKHADKVEDQTKSAEKTASGDPRLQDADWLVKNRTPEQNQAAAVDSLQRVAALMDKLSNSGHDVSTVIGGNFYGGVIKDGQATPDKVKQLLASLKSVGDMA